MGTLNPSQLLVRGKKVFIGVGMGMVSMLIGLAIVEVVQEGKAKPRLLVKAETDWQGWSI